MNKYFWNKLDPVFLYELEPEISSRISTRPEIKT